MFIILRLANWHSVYQIESVRTTV